MPLLRALLLTVAALPAIVRAQTYDIAAGTRVRMHVVAPEFRVTIALTGNVVRTTADSVVIARADGIGSTAVARAAILDFSVSLGRESAMRSLAHQLPFVALPIAISAGLASSGGHSHTNSRLLLVPFSIVALHVSVALMSRRERWQPVDVASLRP